MNRRGNILPLTLAGMMIVIAILLIFAMSKMDYGEEVEHTGTNSQEMKTEESTNEINREDNQSTQSENQEVIIPKDTYNGDVFEDNGSPYCIKVNRQKNVVTVYALDEEGYYTVPVKAMLCSVGLNNNTPVGTYHLGAKYEWALLVGDVWGQYAYRIEGSIMFHSVPYYTRDKGDLESEEYNKLGEAASKGCVRLCVCDAKWIFENCPKGTIVQIFDSDYEGPLGKPGAFTIDLSGENRGWDPTDIDEENPCITTYPVIFGAVSRTVERGETYDVLSGVSAYNQYGEEITGDIIVTGLVDASKVGEYPLVYQVTDAEGNEAKVSVVITVDDTVKPVMTVVPDGLRLNAKDLSPVNIRTALLENASAADSGVSLPKDNIYVDYEELLGKTEGIFTVKYYAQDEAGNQSDVMEAQVLIDGQAPAIGFREELGRSITREQAGDAEYLKSLVEVTDNYDGCELNISLPMTANPSFQYVVMYMARDKCGNISTLSVAFDIKE